MSKNINEILSRIVTYFRKLQIDGFGTIDQMNLDKNGDLQLRLSGGQKKTVKGVGLFLDEKAVKMAHGVTRELHERGLLEGILSMVKFFALVLLIVIIAVIVLLWTGVSTLFKACK